MNLRSLLQRAYFFLYLIFLLLCLSAPDFIPLWVFIEFTSFIFFCLLFSLTTNFSYTSLIVYFLIQSASSLGLLFFFLVSSTSSLFFFFFLVIKIGIFPFNFWYFFSLSRMPRTGVFLSLTFQKIPPLYLVSYFWHLDLIASYYLVLIFLLFNLVFSLFLIPQASTLLNLLIISSLFNNSWLFISSYCDFYLFLFFSLLYFTLTFFLLFYSSKVPTICLFTLMGLPPFPLFFVKFTIVWVLLNSSVITSVVLIIFILILSNFVNMTLYFNYLSSFYKVSFSNSFIKV